VKRRRLNVQLTNEQQLIVALLLVILLAISMLYCLGFASLALHQTLEKTILPWNSTSPPGEEIEIMPGSPPVEATPPPATPS
jgi:hypothetical protein